MILTLSVIHILIVILSNAQTRAILFIDRKKEPLSQDIKKFGNENNDN